MKKRTGMIIALLLTLGSLTTFGFFFFLPSPVKQSSAEYMWRETSPSGTLEFVVTMHINGDHLLSNDYTCLSLCFYGDKIDDAIEQYVSWVLRVSLPKGIKWITDDHVELTCLRLPDDPLPPKMIGSIKMSYLRE